MRITKLINAILISFISILLIISIIYIVIDNNPSNGLKINGQSFHLTNMLPGDSQTQNYKFTVYHWKDTFLYFQINNVKTTGMFNLSEKLLVNITIPSSGTSLFSGTMAELTQHALSLELPKNNRGYTAVEYSIRAYLPNDVNNDYQFTSFTGDFKWWIYKNASFAPWNFILIALMITFFIIIALFIWFLVSTKCGNCCCFSIYNLILLVFLLILFIFIICFFHRTSIVVPNNQFETGGVVIDLNDGEKVFKDSYITPGEIITKQITIKNVGSASVNYKLYLKNVRGLLKEDIVFNFYYQNLLIKTVHPSDFTAHNPLYSNQPLESNSKITYTLEVLMPEQIGNYSEQQFLDFDIVLDAIQAKNNLS